MPEEQDFPPVIDQDHQAWQQAVRSLFANHMKLVEAIKGFGDSRLEASVPGRPYKFYRLFQSTTQHAVYHAGQIALLKKAPKIHSLFLSVVCLICLLGTALLAVPAQARPFAYVTNSSSSSVSVIDTVTNTVIDTIGVGTGPLGSFSLRTDLASTWRTPSPTLSR